MDYLTRTGVTLAGYVFAAIFLGLYIGAKSDIKAEAERCNTDKAVAIQEAQEALRVAREESLLARIAELEQFALDERKAREIAQEAERAALERPERVREVIRRVADANSCLNQPVPADILNSLR